MNELALFAGAGGGLLATKWLLGWRTVCYVENAAYPVEVLKARIRDGLLDDAPIWDDARTFDGRPWRGCVDIVTAGFPCQPFSGAGKRLGENDDRNLWPDTARIIREVRPQYVLLENVPTLRCPIRGHRSYFGRVLGDLAESGYDARWDCVPASAIGANHQRDRLWIVAYASCRAIRQQYNNATPEGNGEIAGNEMAHAASERRGETGRLRSAQSEEWLTSSGEEMAHANGEGFQECAQLNRQPSNDTANGNPCRGHVGGRSDEVAHAPKSRWEGTARAGMSGPSGAEIKLARCSETVANADSEGLLEQGAIGGKSPQSIAGSRRHWGRWWQAEPDVGRVVDGLPKRVDRLKALGNAQVPAVVAIIWGLLSRD